VITVPLVKRRALHRGEIGFFPNDPMAEEDTALISLNSETMHTIKSEPRLEALRYLWGLVHKAQENSDFFLDRYKAMHWLKLKVGYSKAVWDPDEEKMIVKPKSLTRINDEQLRLLTDRIADAICEHILPGIKQEDLRREVEEMLAGPRATS
jgi:hypothetical protein